MAIVPPDRRPRAALAAILAASALVVLFHFDPASAGFFPPCFFRAATGLACPGCGGLRAMHALLHGEVRHALLLNPLAVLLLPPALAVAAAERSRARRGMPTRVARAAIWAAGAVVLLFWVLRNLPYEPFVRFAAR